MNYSQPLDTAKDIVAFANTFGGTILVGVSEKNEVATGIRPGVNFAKIKKHINNNVRSLFSSIIHFETHLIEMSDDEKLVSINVEPTINLVGCCTDKNVESFCFLYRTEYGNKFFEFIEVEQRMFESVSRKNYLKLLSYLKSVNEDHLINIYSSYKNIKNEKWSVKILEDSHNEFELILVSANKAHRIPYSFIEEIWNDGKEISIMFNKSIRLIGGTSFNPERDFELLHEIELTRKIAHK